MFGVFPLAAAESNNLTLTLGTQCFIFASLHRETKATPVRTYSPKPGDVDAKWYVIDATDVVLGRLAAQVATLLRGKHKPTFAPHADGGDYVIIVNADKIALTGSKREQK